MERGIDAEDEVEEGLGGAEEEGSNGEKSGGEDRRPPLLADQRERGVVYRRESCQALQSDAVREAGDKLRSR